MIKHSLLKKSSIVLLFSVFTALNAYTQAPENVSKLTLPVIPPTPEASVFAKYGEIPVDYRTGVPSISIPVFTIQMKDISIPIELRYHGGGFKVDEVAGNVGLGWSLGGTGVVSQTIIGLRDYFDGSSGYSSKSEIQSLIDQDPVANSNGNFFIDMDGQLVSISGKPTNQDKWNNKEWDTDPDVFSFSFPGGGGKFFFGKDGKLYEEQKSSLRIKILNLTVGSFDGFEITDGLGKVYRFSQEERQQVEGTCESSSLGDRRFDEYASSYYLSSICSPSGGCVYYEYTNYSYVYHIGLSQTKNVAAGPGGNFRGPSLCMQKVSITQGKQLKRIFTDTGLEVKFSYGQNRTDLPTPISGSTGALRKIEILKDGLLHKEFELSHAYSIGFSDPLSIVNGIVPNAEYNSAKHRLMLSSFKEIGCEPYMFYYDSNVLPNRFSFAQDFWGYYNGANDNTTLVPGGVSYGYYLSGGTRSPSSTFMKSNSLSKIVYPTKGYSEFDFEPHSRPYQDYSESSTSCYKKWASNSVSLTSSGNQGPIKRKFIIPSSIRNLQYFYTTNICDEEYTELITPVNGLPFSQAMIINEVNFTGLSGSNSLILDEGVYSLSLWTEGLTTDCSTVVPVTTSIKVSWEELVEVCPPNEGAGTLDDVAIFGGLRVKSIRDFDHTNALVYEKNYEYDEENINNDIYTLEQGALVPNLNLFSYTTYSPSGQAVSCNPDLYFTSMGTNYEAYHTRGSSSLMNLSFQTGGNIVYNKVIEKFIDPNQTESESFGKTVFIYRDVKNQFSLKGTNYAETDYSWLGAQLLRKEIYKSNDLDPIRVTKYNYTIHYQDFGATNKHFNEIWGVKISRSHTPFFVQIGGFCFPVVPKYQYATYKRVSLWETLDSEETIDYSGSGIFSSIVVYNYSMNTRQLISSVSSRSDGLVTSNYFVYTKDISSNGLNFDSFNYIDFPVYTYSGLAKKDLNGGVTNSLISVTKNNLEISSNKIRVVSQQQSEFPTPIIVPSLINLRTDYSSLDSYLNPIPKVKLAYNSFGNVNEVEQSGVSKLYIWGYNNRAIIAELININQQELIGKIGLTTYNQLAASKDSNWIKNTLSSLKGQLSSNQLMKIFLYNQDGVSEIIDENGKSTHFYYDSKGKRLEIIKDDNGNIVQTFDYNYKSGQ